MAKDGTVRGGSTFLWLKERGGSMKYVKKKLSELKPYENYPRINDEAEDKVRIRWK